MPSVLGAAPAAGLAAAAEQLFRRWVDVAATQFKEDAAYGLHRKGARLG